jgi:hypothetical protein
VLVSLSGTYITYIYSTQLLSVRKCSAE